MLGEGLKAMTIRVNDVDGVAGFVLPGDRVDVMLTRQIDKGDATNDVVLQNVKVLAIDQLADERTDKPSVVKAVTLEVDTVGGAEARAGRLARHLLAAAAQGRRDRPTASRLITLTDLGVADADADDSGNVRHRRRSTRRRAEAGIQRAESRRKDTARAADGTMRYGEHRLGIRAPS